MKDWIISVLGLIKIDSVTWFLDYLFISYICIWALCRLKTTCQTLLALGFVASVNMLYFMQSSSPFWEILDVLGLYGGFMYARYGNNLPVSLFSNRSMFMTMLVFLLTYFLWVLCHGNMMFRYSFMLMLIYDIAALLAVVFLSRKLHVSGRAKTIISKLSALSYFIYLVHMKAIDVLYTVYGLDNLLLSITVTVLVAGLVQFLYKPFQYYIVERKYK